MYEQAPPGTYHPNLLDLIGFLIKSLTSPSGNLVWDLLLQAVGIFVTVVVLQRYFERREEMRWAPARQHLYMRLFGDVNWLIGLLPAHVRDGYPTVAYRFGYASYVAEEYDGSFVRKLESSGVPDLAELADECADRPELLESFKEALNTTLEHSATVFLAREPELNRAVSQLREDISGLEGSLEIYRGARKTGRDPARVGGSTAIEQVVIVLKMVMFDGYHLRTWLADQADSVEPLKL